MSKFKTVLAALAVIAVMAPSAHATTFGAEVFGAFNTYNMEDVNDALAVENSLGYNYDELTSGMTGGLGMRMWPNTTWMIEACWEPLFLETESTANNSTWNMDANSFQVSAYHFFPSANPKAKFGLGGGVGIYSVNGENVDPSLVPTTLKIEGSGPGFHVMGVSEWTMNSSFNLTAGAGFRFANIEIDNSGNNATADYSGFTARVGMAFYFPQSK